MGNFFRNLGSSDWWFGENSMFGSALGTVADSGIITQLGEAGVIGGKKPEGVDPNLILYAGVGFMALILITNMTK